MRAFLLMLVVLLFFAACGGEKNFVSTFPQQLDKTLSIGPHAPRKAAGGVLFSWSADAGVRKVSLAGTFNGWDKTADPLVKGRDGIWRLTKKLAPGKYFYKYVENGANWYTDRDNPHRDETGYENAVITVAPDGEVLIRNQVITAANPGHYYRQYSAVTSAAWVRDAVVYELFARTFSREGFAGITKKLPYLQDLGINTLWLMPIHEIGRVKRKGKLGSPYSVMDYYSVNHEFGSKADFKALVDAAHARGMRVIIDWVANHSSWDNRLLDTNPDFYTKDKQGRIISPMPDWSDVADFNYDNPGMRAYMLEALKYWVREFGIDGYRMDTAAIVPLDFWRQVRAELVKLKPDVMLLAESDEEIHHVGAFDLTYEGALRNVLKKIADGEKTQFDFHRAWTGQKYSFPKNALRLHWQANHDQPHALQLYGDKVIYPATTILLTLEGPVLLLMGAEFGDFKWKNNDSLFDPLQLSWESFDKKLFAHHQALLKLRAAHPALSHGTLELVENDNPRVISYLRVLGKERFLVAVSMLPRETEVVFSPRDLVRLGIAGTLRLTELFPAAGSPAERSLKGKAVTLGAYAGRVWKVDMVSGK